MDEINAENALPLGMPLLSAASSSSDSGESAAMIMPWLARLCCNSHTRMRSKNGKLFTFKSTRCTYINAVFGLSCISRS